MKPRKQVAGAALDAELTRLYEEWLKVKRRVPFRAYLSQHHRAAYNALAHLTPAERLALPKRVRLGLKPTGAKRPLSQDDLLRHADALVAKYLALQSPGTFQNFLRGVTETCATEADLKRFISS